MRIITVKDRKELESKMSELSMMKYSTKSQTETNALMKKTEIGGIGIHIVLLIFTAGIGNILYGVYKYLSSDEVLIKIEIPEL